MPDDTSADLPQTAVLQSVVERLKNDEQVRAAWLGGSFAAGAADRYSDVDLRIAIAADQISAWRTPDWPAIFDLDRVGATFMSFGDDAFLHHLVLADGSIFDFFVQSTTRDNHEHAIKVLFCSDPIFADRLKDFARPISAELPPAKVDELSQLIVDFWITSHKHRKVLGRKLHLLATVGVQHERMILLRLWQTLLTGRDTGGRPSIHGLSASTREIESRMGESALNIFGAPLRTEREIVQAIEINRDEVARVGRLLASREGFEYPEQLERVVRSCWVMFRA